MDDSLQRVLDRLRSPQPSHEWRPASRSITICPVCRHGMTADRGCPTCAEKEAREMAKQQGANIRKEPK